MIIEQDGKRYIKLFHRYGRGKAYTLKDFMDKNRILFMEPKELFDLNKLNIFLQYSDKDKEYAKKEYGKYPESENDIKLDWYLPSSCYILIPAEKVTMDVAISSSTFQKVEEYSFSAFSSKKIRGLLKHEGYLKSDDGFSKGVPNPFVLYVNRYGMIRDISDYVISLNTSVSSEGGQFSISLPFIRRRTTFNRTELQLSPSAMFSSDGSGVTFVSSQVEFEKTYDKLVKGDNGEFLAKSEVSHTDDFMFSEMGGNELIFIAFEELSLENREELKSMIKESDEEVNTEVLALGTWDMIGLIDTIEVSLSTPNTQSVSVSGRDLMKLLIEDGSFFYTYSSTAELSDIFANREAVKEGGDQRSVSTTDGKFNAIDRIRMFSGNVLPFENVINKDLGYIATVVMGILSNIEIFPSEVFTPWGKDRTEIVDFKFKKIEE